MLLKTFCYSIFCPLMLCLSLLVQIFCEHNIKCNIIVKQLLYRYSVIALQNSLDPRSRFRSPLLTLLFSIFLYICHSILTDMDIMGHHLSRYIDATQLLLLKRFAFLSGIYCLSCEVPQNFKKFIDCYTSYFLEYQKIQQKTKIQMPVENVECQI